MLKKKEEINMTILTTDNFEQEVMHSDKLTVVDFWATWCGPCMMIAPVVEELAGEMENVKFCKVNVDEQMELAMAAKVESIPTLLIIKEQKTVARLVGYREKAALKKEIEKYL